MRINCFVVALVLPLMGLIAETSIATPTFSMHNKSRERLTVKIVYEGAVVIKGKVFPCGKPRDCFFDANIDFNTKKYIVLQLFQIPSDIKVYEGRINVKDAEEVVYINYNDNRDPAVYPQRKPKYALSDKTELGYSLQKNINASNIITIFNK